MGLAQKMNSSGDIDLVRNILSEIIDKPIDKSTIIFPPFYTNFGRFIHIGKNVFINHACSFLDMGGIYIDDEVLIGPKVNLITENHPLDSEDRKALITKPITLKRRAWIGAGSTILPGVTVGQNAVVAAGSVVSKDVPDNVVVGGVPAKFIKSIYSGQVLENDRTVIKPKELDIYLPELKLALEYNGEYWHDETKKRKPGYHKEKQKACEKKGIKLIEVWDSEWHADKDRFKNLIQEVINSIQSPLKI